MGGRQVMKWVVNRQGVLVRCGVIAGLICIWIFFASPELSYSKAVDYSSGTGKDAVKQAVVRVEGSIMPSMADQEAKEALGRASWKYLHTLLARYPDDPSEQERAKLGTFIELYAELYPCGECSVHLQKMVKKYPVQTSSRTAAALWGCHIHNMVNEYLKKAEYDCSTILEDYDCGCGDSEIELGKVSVEKEGKQLG